MALPPVFLAVGASLPPTTPRYLRGVTLATVTWVEFAPSFRPEAGSFTVATVPVASGHWVYGATLGVVVHPTVGLPRRRV